MSTTAQLDVEELVDGQNQAEIDVNEGFQAFDAVIQLAVIDRDLTAPPGSPVTGDRYIVATGGTGDWLGHDGDLAVWLNLAWRFFEIKEGWMVWIEDENLLLLWDGATYISISAGSSSIMVQEDDVTVSATASVIDFTEPLATIVTESPSGEANVNLAAYLLASGARALTGNLDFANNLALNLGAAGTDFTAGGGLNLAEQLKIAATKLLRFDDSDSSNFSAFQAGNQSTDVTYTLPTAAPGANGQVLACTTAGVLSWSGTSPDAGNSQQRIFHPAAPFITSTSFLTVTNTAYWCYIGYLPLGMVLNFVECWNQAAGSGTQTAEMAIASTPSAPNRAGQTLTVLAVTGSLDSFGAGTSGTVRRNSSGLAYALTANTHIWAGCRFAMATTQPNLAACVWDWSDGTLLQTATPGVLTTTTYSGTVPGLGSGLAPAIQPYLRITID